MKNILFYIALFFAACFFGCNKIELPDPVHGTPVFNAELNFINGDVKKWEAGVDDYYMFTEFEKDNLGVYSFIGRMEKLDCDSACKGTLAIYIRDYEVSPLGTPSINEAFSLDEYHYFSKENTTAIIVLDTISNFYTLQLVIDTTITNHNSQTFYEWTIDGNTFSNFVELSLVQGYDLPPYQSEVTLKVTDISNGDSCVTWQTQTIAKNDVAKCAVAIQQVYNPDFLLESLLAVPITFNGAVFYQWSTGSTEEIISGPFEPNLDYTVTMQDVFGCQSVAGSVWSGLTLQDTLKKGCSAHFDYSVMESPSIDTSWVTVPNDSFQYSTVTIIYTDENGRTFRSDIHSQSANAQFNILSSEDYDENENGQPTKKLALQFNCTLWDNNNNELIIENGKAIWGVAYPE